jgi:hypothetical protein
MLYKKLLLSFFLLSLIILGSCQKNELHASVKSFFDMYEDMKAQATVSEESYTSFHRPTSMYHDRIITKGFPRIEKSDLTQVYSTIIPYDQHLPSHIEYLNLFVEDLDHDLSNYKSKSEIRLKTNFEIDDRTCYLDIVDKQTILIRTEQKDDPHMSLSIIGYNNDGYVYSHNYYMVMQGESRWVFMSHYLENTYMSHQHFVDDQLITFIYYDYVNQLESKLSFNLDGLMDVYFHDIEQEYAIEHFETPSPYTYIFTIYDNTIPTFTYRKSARSNLDSITYHVIFLEGWNNLSISSMNGWKSLYNQEEKVFEETYVYLNFPSDSFYISRSFDRETETSLYEFGSDVSFINDDYCLSDIEDIVDDSLLALSELRIFNQLSPFDENLLDELFIYYESITHPLLKDEFMDILLFPPETE